MPHQAMLDMHGRLTQQPAWGVAALSDSRLCWQRTRKAMRSCAPCWLSADGAAWSLAGEVPVGRLQARAAPDLQARPSLAWRCPAAGRQPHVGLHIVRWSSRWVLAVQCLDLAGQLQDKWMCNMCQDCLTSMLDRAGQRLWLMLWLRRGLWACTLDWDTCSPGRRLHRPAEWPRQGCGALGQALWPCKILCWPAPSQVLIEKMTYGPGHSLLMTARCLGQSF